MGFFSQHAIVKFNKTCQEYTLLINGIVLLAGSCKDCETLETNNGIFSRYATVKFIKTSVRHSFNRDYFSLWVATFWCSNSAWKVRINSPSKSPIDQQLMVVTLMYQCDNRCVVGKWVVDINKNKLLKLLSYNVQIGNQLPTPQPLSRLKYQSGWEPFVWGYFLADLLGLSSFLIGLLPQIINWP